MRGAFEKRIPGPSITPLEKKEILGSRPGTGRSSNSRGLVDRDFGEQLDSGGSGRDDSAEDSR